MAKAPTKAAGKAPAKASEAKADKASRRTAGCFGVTHRVAGRRKSKPKRNGKRASMPCCGSLRRGDFSRAFPRNPECEEEEEEDEADDLSCGCR